MTVEPHTLHEPDQDFDRLPVLSQLETDRFCENCGYNLRMQGVRRDPRLAILVVRCPECSRYHPVAAAGTLRQIWWQRLATLFILTYALFLLGLMAGFGSTELAIMIGTTEELNRRGWSPQGGQYATRLYQRPHDPDYLTLMALATAGSLATGYVAVALAVTFCHHWYRWGYMALAAALPLLVAAILWLILEYDGPASIRIFAYPYITWLTGWNMIGGLLASRTGRPLARALARLLLPPGLRAYLSCLWSADGLQPPPRPPSTTHK